MMRLFFKTFKADHLVELQDDINNWRNECGVLHDRIMIPNIKECSGSFVDVHAKPQMMELEKLEEGHCLLLVGDVRMKIALLGHNGFLGKKLEHKLKAANHQVYCMRSSELSNWDKQDFDWIINSACKYRGTHEEIANGSLMPAVHILQYLETHPETKVLHFRSVFEVSGAEDFYTTCKWMSDAILRRHLWDNTKYITIGDMYDPEEPRDRFVDRYLEGIYNPTEYENPYQLMMWPCYRGRVVSEAVKCIEGKLFNSAPYETWNVWHHEEIKGR